MLQRVKKKLPGLRQLALMTVSLLMLGVLSLIVLVLLGLTEWAILVVGLLVATTALMGLVSLLLLEKRSRALNKVAASAQLSPAVVTPTGHLIRRHSAPSLGNFLGAEGAFFGIGPQYEYAQRVIEGGGHLETFTLRTKSHAMRDVLARASTNLQFDFADLMRLVWTLSSGQLQGGTEVVRDWRPSELKRLARVLANQNANSSDLWDAYRLYRLLIDVWGEKTLGRTDAYVVAEVFFAIGEVSRGAQIFRRIRARNDQTHYQLLQANAVRREMTETEDDWSRWLERINVLLDRDNLAPISVGTEGDTYLDALRTEVEPRSVNGPLVSVIVPTFQGGGMIGTTLRSLVEQTWKNLEIIVVDDGSTEEHFRKIESACAEFPEVRLIRQEENLGAYIARNAGLQASSGDFITVHDDDDWSHAQKIELQAKHLLQNRQLMANKSSHVRTYEDLTFTRINNNPSFSQPNYSSLLVRREAFDTVGGWDLVNRGADAEFRDRLLEAFPEDIPTVAEAPVSFTRVHGGSLTAGEFGRGYIDPSRLFYQAAYQNAHRKAASDPGILRQLEFSRPLNMTPGMRGRYLGKFDVVFMTDFRFPGGTMSLTVNEIRAAAEVGYRVGVIHSESPLNGNTSFFDERALEVGLQDNVELLSLSDQADIDLLVVRHPTVVQFADKLTSNLDVNRVVVIVNNPPVLAGGTGYGFDFDDVVENAERMFSAEIEIVPESGVTRQGCVALVGPHRLADYNWPGFIDTDRFSPRRGHDFSLIPVLGRHSRDSALKWPDKCSAVMEIYAGDEKIDVKLLGGVQSLPEETRSLLKENSQVIDFGGMEAEEYLQSVDFWAYFHSDKLRESFGMSVVEAMASGCVVILPHYMEINFGEAALYAEPQEVQELALRLWNNPEEYRSQAELARRTVEEEFSESAFHRRLEKLIRNAQKTLR